MTRDRFTQQSHFDYARPRDRVPREPSAAPALPSLFIGVAAFCLFLYALPDLAVWFSTWGICR